MSKVCSQEGFKAPVFARDLCSRHYQQQRRAGFSDSVPTGRPREYPKDLADPHGGAPKLTVRLEPELMGWVKDQGGATWLRNAARKLKRLSDDPSFRAWWKEFSRPEDS